MFFPNHEELRIALGLNHPLPRETGEAGSVVIQPVAVRSRNPRHILLRPGPALRLGRRLRLMVAGQTETGEAYNKNSIRQWHIP